MSKVIPINLLNTYKGKVTQLCQVMKLTLKDGTVMGFTSFDQDIILQEEPTVIYKALTGMTPTAVSSSSAFNVDNLDIEGFLSDERITESDIKAGRYDYADIVISEMSWKDKPYSLFKLNIKRFGKLGEIRVEGGKFIAEIRGLMQYLQNNIGELYQTSCRAYLGDSKCGVDLIPFTFDSSVLTVESNRSITCNLNNDTGYFDGGKITFLTGLNINLTLEVKSWNLATQTIEFQLPTNYTINIGDTFRVVKGCDGLIKTCQDVFGNAKRFRGEPYIPQTEALVRT